MVRTVCTDKFSHFVVRSSQSFNHYCIHPITSFLLSGHKSKTRHQTNRNRLCLFMMLSKSLVWLILASSSHSFTVFTPRIASPPSVSSLGSTTLAPPEVISSNTTGITAWECDEDAVCVQVPACDDQICRTSLDVRIHGEWYDLSGTLRLPCAYSFKYL